LVYDIHIGWLLLDPIRVIFLACLFGILAFIAVLKRIGQRDAMLLGYLTGLTTISCCLCAIGFHLIDPGTLLSTNPADIQTTGITYGNGTLFISVGLTALIFSTSFILDLALGHPTKKKIEEVSGDIKEIKGAIKEIREIIAIQSLNSEKQVQDKQAIDEEVKNRQEFETSESHDAGDSVISTN